MVRLCLLGVEGLMVLSPSGRGWKTLTDSMWLRMMPSVMDELLKVALIA